MSSNSSDLLATVLVNGRVFEILYQSWLQLVTLPGVIARVREDFYALEGRKRIFDRSLLLFRQARTHGEDSDLKGQASIQAHGVGSMVQRGMADAQKKFKEFLTTNFLEAFDPRPLPRVSSDKEYQKLVVECSKNPEAVARRILLAHGVDFLLREDCGPAIAQGVSVAAQPPELFFVAGYPL